MPRTSYAIALGSNRRHGRHGAPEKVIAAALAALEAQGVRVLRASPVIRTAAIGPAGRGFANAAVIVECDLDPPALLALLKRTERAFGRRPGRRWGPRVLDLDIILWSGGGWAGPRLAIPHAAFATRAFVLDPLVRIAPDWRHPKTARTVRQMRARLGRASG
ncbi:2-amino-4-hydroxy-6-hydroxymethyldihydropteridinediphosphokinase [Sphingomonas laterariae]|uniref:2-amino-4-hydroxy-6-hydroxymethyldihydropteridine pyrophosphokinase n=1 Tax=Edaphosphingomonas laterariae TaxID=861865 RepID=A0A239JQU8_9SPHN|nr:2-amino-4-hydroxy-6-hydroxymethyldihydropteridine diphosphokinase [Sphingomonas laterariae]SNT08185.1 2-amino-4-hydroxy-6-hydroxymethyldihydropteridinediphosphokinase [Sphingomonas laterariae]